MTTKPKTNLKDALAILEAAAKNKRENRIDFFIPYAKQIEFFDLGRTKRERLLQAGNQLGKTWAGAAEMDYHLTGEYPDWWMGRRFDRPIKAWAAGVSSNAVRDIQQGLLCGAPGVEGSLGTGMIPKRLFVDKPSMARGITDAFDMIQVRHKSGGISILHFKSYEQGREKFQGASIDVVWLDEEPKMDIYSECLTRVSATKGMVYLTFTPLQGMSDVVSKYHNEASPDRAYVVMTIFDVGHYTPEERTAVIAGYPAHEREARSMGTPMMGSGRIFPYSDESIAEPAIVNIPPHWTKLWGIDFGIGHNFGAVLTLWDRDLDCLHIHAAIRVADQLPISHAAAMKAVGAAIPVAWPQDGTDREKSTGEPLAAAYKRQGLRMLPEHATFPDGSVSTEAAVVEMQERMTTGKLKVASHLSQWFEEFRHYHRKDGLIVKLHDDLISATQKAVMMKRHGRPVALGSFYQKRQTQSMASGIDFDLFQV